MEISLIHMQFLVHLHVNIGLRTRTRFKTEAKCNSEMAYCFTADPSILKDLSIGKHKYEVLNKYNKGCLSEAIWWLVIEPHST